jgi:hypothetical protein
MAVIAGERAKNTKASHLQNVKVSTAYIFFWKAFIKEKKFHINQNIFGTLNDAANIHHLKVWVGGKIFQLLQTWASTGVKHCFASIYSSFARSRQFYGFERTGFVFF